MVLLIALFIGVAEALVGMAPDVWIAMLSGAGIDLGAVTLAFAAGSAIIVAAAVVGPASGVPRQMADEAKT